MVVWLVIFNGEVVGMDSLMLWSYDWLDEGMKFMFLFFEVGQCRLRVVVQCIDVFELQVVFGLDNGVDCGWFILKINQEWLIVAEVDIFWLKLFLDFFQFVYWLGVFIFICLDMSVVQYCWMYEQYVNDLNVNVLFIFGFCIVECLCWEGEVVVLELEINRVELLYVIYIDMDIILEYYELYDKVMIFYWCGLSGIWSNEVQFLYVFQYVIEDGMLLEIGGLEYLVL